MNFLHWKIPAIFRKVPQFMHDIADI